LFSVTKIRRLGPDDWQVFRRVRLAALKDAPEAFGSTLEREAQYTEAHWREWLARPARVRFVAELDDQVIGTVGGGPYNDGDAAELTSMWVDPDSRRRGVGQALVRVVIDWAREAGLTQVLLWVADGNERAERLYARNGFRRTGDVQEIRKGEGRIEYEMSLRF
jgi:RimJ/RimL family protein N-acetyltransferase